MSKEVKRFKVGQAVYFCHCYGEGCGSKPYRWGKVRVGFITNEEFIEARNQYLYTVGTVDPYHEYSVVHKILGPHLIFEYDNFVGALAKVKELCQEVDDEE